MKFIHKGKEPKKWKAYRETKGATFRAIDELQLALLEDQGYLCCYCMSRISKDKMKVEHWKPRRYKNLVLDFNNLFAACKGDFCTDKHCDTKKDEDEIILHPADPTNNCEAIIDYSLTTGKLIYPEAYKKDIESILNLNNKILTSNRLAVLKAVISVLHIKKYNNAFIQKQITKFESTDDDGKFEPFCQIILKLLYKKKKSNLNNDGKKSIKT
jgi:uncharacterized protein (TIGR02646 family)